jgi:uncharacterized protein
MPVQVTYPGVYVEEIPSGVRTITGVATSITAFVGWAPKGPTDRAELVLSWMDFERKFGGLYAQSLLGYAVSQFFANGGTQAYIVRLVYSGPEDSVRKLKPAKPSFVDLIDGFDVKANSPGKWGDDYGISTTIRVDENNRHRFTLSVVFDKTNPAVVESFENLSMDQNDPRYVETIVNNNSDLISISINHKKVVTEPADPIDPADPEKGMTPPPNITKPKMLQSGDNGTVLKPNEPEFENAMSFALGVGSLPAGSTPLNLLDKINLFNLLCVPGETSKTTQSGLIAFCRGHRAFYIADSFDQTPDDLKGSNRKDPKGVDGITTGENTINAAYYYPWVIAPDPNRDNTPRDFPPSGFIAGIYARTDSARGVWKAPAGIDASITGISGLKYRLTDSDNGILNPQAINCLRDFNVYGPVVWGARTLRGNDEIGSEWKYIPVRRTALFIEESLFRGLKWVVFEPNDEPLWAQIRLNVGAFMHDLFVQGAFQGTTPREAYFVKCDKETTTQNDINRGIVNILVGFAPLKPAEFVILKIQQIAGQIQT